jgi:flavin-dependent dehydrogenase
MTGEGIAQALLSGRLAALALLEAGPFDPSVAESNYQSSLDKSLARDHKFAGQLQSFLTSSLATEMAIKASDINGWTRRNFARWLFEDYPRALIFTPDRWKPGALTSDGAYKVKSRNVSAQDEEYAFTGEQNE